MTVRRFDEFTLDSSRRQLFRQNDEVHLSPKAFLFLELLVERRPSAVSRADIFEHLWPKTIVAESNLASLVQEIRQALDDDARQPRFIRTVFGYGYAFISDVAAAERRTSRFRLLHNTSELPLSAGETILGREIPLLEDSVGVSRQHARIVVSGDAVTIEDLGSKNGTFVGGRRISAPLPLVDGDVVVLGRVELTFQVRAALETTATLQSPSAT